ncbi:proclavaminate amidinohydrolase [Purpureocillium lavendulum]|uniref:Proclavaminate amidinohydrolase n=1 Tax=Purpureocillium lavendulum TaxID=1247861 RepID=A0AB34FVE2_9HYPO|nr:proclavaminate amidinohydrolase [Purpureocillium lavendulum]
MRALTLCDHFLVAAVFAGETLSAHGPAENALPNGNFAQALAGQRDNHHQQRFKFWLREDDEDDGHDDSMAMPFQFAGLNTFAKVPWADCFSKGGTDNRYDIAILGAPHDTTVTARPGARYGPTSIRTASQEKAYGFSIFTGRNPLHDWAKIVDCGDAPLPWLDSRAAVKTLDRAHKLVSSRIAASTHRSTVPRIVALGGDHTTTLSALRSTFRHWGKVSVVHFDSHIDTWDPAVLGGGISDYAGLNHGTFLHVAHEEVKYPQAPLQNLILNSSIHAGIRAPVNRRKADMENDRRCGFHTIMAREIDRSGIKAVVDTIRKRVGDTNIYISVDIDVLDPAFAPATGTPEPGGWSSRELLSILEGLEGLNIIGGDVVEVAPVYDTVGETTALVAAEVAHTIVDLMVANPVSPPTSKLQGKSPVP